LTGKISHLVRERLFGFIRGEDGREYFFHRAELEGASFYELDEDDAMVFEPADSPKGPRVTKVHRADSLEQSDHAA
jgi:cold shock CspA family protein